ncbi:MAG: hypothetical protein JWO87_243 [Phycisphaerales bacterium]|nr:hypothetical protein [Phycisphaerales bacterium]
MVTGARSRLRHFIGLTLRPALGSLTAIALAAALFAPAARAADGAGPKSIFDDDFPSSPGTTSTPGPRRTSPPAVRPVPPDPDTPVRPTPTPPAERPVPPERVARPPADPDSAVPKGDNGDEVTPGLVAQLFDGADFGRVKETRLVRRVRVSFERPASSVGTVLPMSFKWKGLLNVPAGGMSARFMLQAHGNVELRVDDASVLTGRGAADAKAIGRLVRLTEGLHPLVLSVSQIKYGGGQETVALSWQPDGEEMQLVPSAVLSHYRKDESAALAGTDDGSKKPKVARKGDLPVPSDAELLDLRKRVKAKFAALYADQTPIARQSLARKLAGEADTSADNAERYALLREAADISAAAGDLKSATLCVESIASVFKVDQFDLQLLVLTTASHAAKTPPAWREVGESAMQLSDQAGEADELDVAYRAATVAETAYAAAKDEEAPRAKARVKELRELQQQFAHVAPLIKKLHDDPEDPDTNMKAGRFFCFTAGRWEKGLAMLAKGSDAGFKALAEAEALTPADADAQLKLGDGWWDRSGSESPATANRCKERACFWYLQARASKPDTFPDRVYQRLGTLSRTIDLLPQIELDANAANLGWKRDHGALICTGGFGTPLKLPYEPFGDYDFIVEYTPTRGNGSLLQTMPVNGTSLSWALNNNYSNFEPLALRPGSWGPMLRGRVVIQPGHRYTSVVQFRHTGVRAIVNGILIREWATDYSELGVGFGARAGAAKCLSLSCSSQEAVIQTIRVVEVPRSSK